MRVALHGRYQDPRTLVARCRELAVDDVCLALAGTPGFAETRVPDRVALAEFVGRVGDAGIRVSTAIDWLGNDPNLVLNPSAHRAVWDAKLQTIETVGQVGIRTVLHYVDLAGAPTPDDERSWEGLIGLFRELVAQAEAANVRLANHAIWRCLPEPLRSQALDEGVTLEGYRDYRRAGWGGPYLCTSSKHVKRLLDAVPSTHNGACFCTGMHIMGGDVPSLVDTFTGKIFYSQMRDVRGRWPAAEEVFLGEGDLDFSSILRRLQGAGYDGPLGPEHLGQPHFPGEDLEARAVRFLQARACSAQWT